MAKEHVSCLTDLIFDEVEGGGPRGGLPEKARGFGGPQTAQLPLPVAALGVE